MAKAREVVRALPCWVGAQARGRALDLLVELGTNVRLAGGGGGDPETARRYTAALQRLREVGPLTAALVEGSSPIPRGKGPVPISAALQGLGAFGRVKVAHTLWRRVVPRSLLGKCRAFLRSATGRLFSARLRSQAQATGGDRGAALRAMLQAVRAEGGFKKTTAPCSASAFLIPKNQEKCRLILNLVRMNREVGVRPPRFRLPQIEDLREWLGSLPPGAKPYFVKVDLANAYWSLRMPRHWRRVFVVNGLAIQRLPFGWTFSPAARLGRGWSPSAACGSRTLAPHGLLRCRRRSCGRRWGQCGWRPIVGCGVLPWGWIARGRGIS